MSGKLNLLSEQTYQNLQKYYNENGQKIDIKNLFSQDPSRFEKFR